MDQSKKTMRHFYCRDVLWETFEQMANDFDCSIDYLVNEAMRYYARSKNYQSPGAPMGAQGAPLAGGNSSTGGGGNSSNGPTSYPPSPEQAAGCERFARPVEHAATAMGDGGAPSPTMRRPQPPTPGYQGGNAVNARSAGPTGGGAMGGLQHSASASASGHAQAAMPAMGGAGPTLFLIYNGQRYPVTKDQFIIGRGSKTSDLPIKDGNISRKHAAVIRRNGTFYIKDLGSTNGIDYKGMRIDNKRIDEGDVFHLCDYELRFTYRAD